MLSSGRIAFVVLAALAAASWWINQRDGQEPQLAERPPPVGFFMTEAEITTPGADGLPRYRLIADEIRQASLDGPTLLREVRVQYNMYSPSPWLLTAPEGVLSADQSRLDLWGGVEVIGETAGQGRTSLETEELEINTEAHIASTAAPVALSLGVQQLNGVGMIAYLLEERLQLQSEVHGRFLP